MTQDQFLMIVRMVLQMGGVAFALAGPDWTNASGAIVTLAGIGWSFWARREAALKASVGTMPNTVVVTTAPTALAASDTHQTTRLAARIAEIPEVQTVISTPEVAAATVSDKVVSQ